MQRYTVQESKATRGEERKQENGGQRSKNNSWIAHFKVCSRCEGFILFSSPLSVPSALGSECAIYSSVAQALSPHVSSLLCH